ncbi:MAG: redoxin domain-containing protein [Bacteroidota bacterium]
MVTFRLIVVLVCIAVFAQAQAPAPDFTITDSNGETRQLYADYLDQGKSVVLKFFFINCPPCNAMAPLMEPFYQSWGGGAYDMEMISLSIRPNDSSQGVNGYKQMHGHTWPGAGGDGGASAAIQPYLQGDYGIFSSTPTFVVIAPDGEVFFNPKGDNFEATLDSVALKLEETGAIKAFQPFQNSGTVSNMNLATITGVELGIAEVDSNLVQTDAAGAFQLDLDINIFEENVLVANRTDSHTNGVNIGDLFRIQQHILGDVPFTSPYQYLAADVNRDGMVSMSDMVAIARTILTIGSVYEQYNPWVFVDADYDFENPTAPATEIFEEGKAQILLNPDDASTYQLIGIKLGDVDASATVE